MKEKPESAKDSFSSAPQEQLFNQLLKEYGTALDRLTGGYEIDRSRREDLQQEILVAMWRSLLSFRGQCSMRTWVYRIAHNTALKHMLANRRWRNRELLTLDEMLEVEDEVESAASTRAELVGELTKLIQRLCPLDRQIILLYLDDLDAVSIGDVVGLSAKNVATKVHRIKKLLETWSIRSNGNE